MRYIDVLPIKTVERMAVGENHLRVRAARSPCHRSLFALEGVDVKMRITFRRFWASLAFVSFVWLAALTARASDPPSVRPAVPGGSSSNQVSVATNAITNGVSNQPSIKRTLPGLTESNGLYSIDIKMEPAVATAPPGSSKVERPQEIIPASMNQPVDMALMLVIYVELTRAELDIGEGVRQVQEYLPLKSTPPMTRIQIVDLLDDLLLKAGVVVTHPDAKHAVFRLKP